MTTQHGYLALADISPKSAMDTLDNYSYFNLRIWGRAHRKSRRRVVRGGLASSLVQGGRLCAIVFVSCGHPAGLIGRFWVKYTGVRQYADVREPARFKVIEVQRAGLDALHG